MEQAEVSPVEKIPKRVVLVSVIGTIALLVLFSFYILLINIVLVRDQSASDIFSEIGLFLLLTFPVTAILFLSSFFTAVRLTFYFKKARLIYSQSKLVKWIYRILFFSVVIAPSLIIIFAIIQQQIRGNQQEHGTYIYVSNKVDGIYIPFNESGVDIKSSQIDFDVKQPVAPFYGEETLSPWTNDNIIQVEGSKSGVSWDKNSGVIELSSDGSDEPTWIRLSGNSKISFDSIIFDYQFEQRNRHGDNRIIIYTNNTLLDELKPYNDDANNTYTSGQQPINTSDLSPGANSLGFVLKDVTDDFFETSDDFSKIRIFNIRVGKSKTAKRVNIAPVMIIKPIPTKIQRGAKVTVDTSKSYDPDRYPRPIFSIDFKQVSGPTLSFDNYESHGSEIFDIIPTEPGEYKFQITLDDGPGRSETTEFGFSVIP